MVILMRLIDADELKAYFGLEKPYNEYWDMERYFCDAINAQQTVDAVPVIRCKDCENGLIVEIRNKDTEATIAEAVYCERFEMGCSKDDYCSSAVRREG